ncbi:MAG: hypothetical protein KDD62_11200, partial [Bdellovibrionales bacterium]|nr:hypothetical protein [Bdellovibrionales bacterium]
FRAASDTWPGRTFDVVAQAAKHCSIQVLVGMGEVAGDSLYNSIACIGSNGELVSRYRKLHLFACEPGREDIYCLPGESLGYVDLGEIRCGLSICFDLRFPELYRRQAMDGATAFVNCAAWSKVRMLHWKSLAIARAIENQCYFIGVNRVGADEDFHMGGGSLVVGPSGEVLIEGGSEQGLFTAEIDLAEVAPVRRQIPVLECRRADIFGSLGQEPSDGS